MAHQEMPQVSLEHPAPHRYRVGLTALFFGLSAAAFAWNVQLLVSTALVGHACYPGDTPRVAPLWSGLWWWLLAIGVAGIVLAIAGGLMSWRNWRRTRNEKSGSAHRLLTVGEGRTRFLAMFGILASCLFMIGLLFSTAAVLVVPLCR